MELQTTDNYGRDWLRANRIPAISPLGEKVAAILNSVWDGIYHISLTSLRRADWGSPAVIFVTVRAADLSTFDGDGLTRLVVLCHDYAVRLELGPGGPGGIRLVFSHRERDGDIYHRHPTMEEAIERTRNRRR